MSSPSNTRVPVHFSSRGVHPLPDVTLSGDTVDLAQGNPKKTVNLAEVRARAAQRRNGSRTLRGTDRQIAEALHREADVLHHKGDYETALVLYHRAAKVCPRDSSHGVAARRTSAAINSLTNPSRTLSKLLPRAKNSDQLAATLCPESAALRASRILKECPNPASAVTQIVEYFDSRPDFWRVPCPAKEEPIAKQSLPKLVSNEVSFPASVALKKMSSALSAGEAEVTLRIGEELLTTVAELQDNCRQRTAVFHLMSLAHVSMGRHDRAVNAVARMVNSAKTSGDVVLMAQSLVTLGKVHLTFGHLDASARAWERMAKDITEPIPRAWLLHEIGRCYLESGRYSQALVMADICLDSAMTASSTKWLLYGKLLSGQALVKLERFSDALEALQVAANIAEDEGDTPTLAYIRDLADQVASVLAGAGFHLKIPEDDQQDTSETSIQEDSHMQTSSGESKRPIWTRKFVSEMIPSPKLVKAEGEALLSSEEFHKDTFSSEDRFSTELGSEIDTTSDAVVSPEEIGVRPDVRASAERLFKELKQTEFPSSHDKTRSKWSLSQESVLRLNTARVTRSEHENSSVKDEVTTKRADAFQGHRDTARTHVIRRRMESPKVTSRGETVGDQTPKERIVIPEIHYGSTMEGRISTIGKGSSLTRENKEHEGRMGNESNSTGRTYGVLSSHALYRHSLPSTPRQQDSGEETSTWDGITTCFRPQQD